MTEEEFRKLAEDAGYEEDEIQDLVNLHIEDGVAFEAIPLIIHNAD